MDYTQLQEMLTYDNIIATAQAVVVGFGIYKIIKQRAEVIIAKHREAKAELERDTAVGALNATNETLVLFGDALAVVVNASSKVTTADKMAFNTTWEQRKEAISTGTVSKTFAEEVTSVIENVEDVFETVEEVVNTVNTTKNTILDKYNNVSSGSKA